MASNDLPPVYIFPCTHCNSMITTVVKGLPDPENLPSLLCNCRKCNKNFVPKKTVVQVYPNGDVECCWDTSRNSIQDPCILCSSRTDRFKGSQMCYSCYESDDLRCTKKSHINLCPQCDVKGMTTCP